MGLLPPGEVRVAASKVICPTGKKTSIYGLPRHHALAHLPHGSGHLSGAARETQNSARHSPRFEPRRYQLLPLRAPSLMAFTASSPVAKVFYPPSPERAI